jgi:hypothetical protein
MLYTWLSRRSEKTIAVVCHAGVIEWMTKQIFANCEMQLWNFDDLTPTNLVDVDDDEDNGREKKEGDESNHTSKSVRQEVKEISLP